MASTRNPWEASSSAAPTGHRGRRRGRAVGEHHAVAQLQHPLHRAFEQHHRPPRARSWWRVAMYRRLEVNGMVSIRGNSSATSLGVASGFGAGHEHRSSVGSPDHPPTRRPGWRGGVVAAGPGDQGPAQRRVRIDGGRRTVGVDATRPRGVPRCRSASPRGPGSRSRARSSGSRSACRSCRCRSPSCCRGSRPRAAAGSPRGARPSGATPMARVMVTTAGRPSGIAATASATAAMNVS